MRKIAILAVCFFVAACAPKTYISKTYDFNNLTRIGVLPFASPDDAFSGAENLFTKSLIKYGYTVVERAQIEEVLKEQNLSASSYLSPSVTRQLGKVLGVDVLLTGEITSYMPEQKQLVYNVSRRTSSEPVFSKEVVKNADGNVQIKSTYAGQQHTSSRDIYPVEYTIYAQVGVVAKMIDVDTAEIIWVGDDTKEGVSGLDALSSSANALIKSFDKKVRKAKQESREKQENI